MTPTDPFLEGTFWDKFWRPIRSRALLLTPESRSSNSVWKNAWKSQTSIHQTSATLFLPKGPSRTKNTTESKFSTGSKFTTAVAKRYRECSEMLLFLGEKEVGKRYRE